MLQPFPVALFTLVRAQLTFSVSFILLLFISTLFNPVKADGSNNSEYRNYGKTVNYNDRRYRNHKWKLLKAPKTVSPRGKTDVSEETYSWKPVSDAVEYTLVVRKRPTHMWRVRLLSQTITAAQAGCASGEALCNYSPGLALDNGRYKWKVRAISSRGITSKWSSYRQFRVRNVVVTENNAPMANDVSASTNQGVSIDIMLEATDLDNDSLTYSVDATSDNGGTISLAGSLVTYSPSQDFVGTDTFTFTANDGTVDSNMATVSIAVNRVNTPPEAVDQSISVDENGSVDFTLNASDADGDPLTYTFINQPVSGVLSGEAPNLTYKPDEGFTGEDSFRYFAVDGFSDTANTTVTITVNAVNTPPLAEAGDAQEVFETQKVTLSGSGSDEDGTIASYFWEQTGGTLVSLDGVNTESLVIDADELTADETLTFTLTVTDNEGATATDNVTVLVKNLEIFDADLIICLGDNNNPQELLTLTGLACNNEVVDDDTDFSELEKLVSLTFLDLSGNKLSNLSTLSGLTSLTNLNLSNNQIVDVSALSGLTSLTTLDLSHNQIEDLSGLSESSSDETVSLRSIQSVSARALSGLTLLTNLNLSYNKISDISSLSELTLLDNLDLSNNQIIDVSVLSELISMRVLNLANNLLIDIQGLTNLINLQQLIIVGNCIEGEESQNPIAQCTDIVVPVNIEPIANADTIDAVENISITYDVLANDTDADGILDKTSVSINAGVSQGSTIINPTTGEITYTPTAGYSGSDSFAYTVQDDGGLVSNEATVSITIDVDTDGDGTGNVLDLDDDGDGFSDADEIAASTDPLDPNSIPTTPPASDAAFKIKIIGDEFRVETNYADGYSYNVDCDNDGIDEVFAYTRAYTCRYPTDGEHVVSITGMFPRFVAGSSTNAEKLISVEQWGTGEWLSFASSFLGAKNMHSINATDSPNLTKVTSMAYTFRDASNFDDDISDWDVSNITSMFGMFSNASSFNSDISNWDVGKVTDMGTMFFNASSFNQDINGWDVGSATNMTGMFAEASMFNSNISSWNVSNVENMRLMFSARYPTTTPNNLSSFNQNISGWDVGNVTDMSYMFNNATEFDQNIGSWDVSNVTDMSNMFNGASKFNQNISEWDVSSVGNMERMFQFATEFNQPLGAWNVRAVSRMGHMFSQASSFDQDLGSWDIGNVYTMVAMFDDVVLSVGNYNSILENWSSLPILKPNVVLDCKQCLFSGFAARDAREFLKSADGPNWDIRDRGEQ